MSILIKGMEMPTRCEDCFCYRHNAEYDYAYCNISSVNVLGNANARLNNCPLVPVPPHGDLIKRIVYRGEVYNAIEAARMNALDGILSDRYKDGFHDGLKRALQILANVEDAPTIIPAEEGET